MELATVATKGPLNHGCDLKVLPFTKVCHINMCPISEHLFSTLWGTSMRLAIWLADEYRSD